MPTYEYQCDKCQTYFTALLKLSERTKPTEEPCEECGTEHSVKQVITCVPPWIDPVRLGRAKAPSDFRQVLKGMKNFYKGSTIKEDIN